MQLISTLQEASEHHLDSLKKVLQKDARVKQILQAHLDVDDIENKKQFLDTLKFFVLNNRNVLQFVDSRDNVKSIASSQLARLRKLTVDKLDQAAVDSLREFVSALFREFSYVEKNGISAALRKELVDWANGNGSYFDLPSWAQRELQSVPGLRPSRPVLVYRGLLFRGDSLKERPRYDGTIEVGRGLKFLRSIRAGSRVVDLEWDRPSSWSTSKEIAMQFAKFRSASSVFSATMNWLQRGDQKIDGDLGFIVSYLARPEDILIDMTMLKTAAHLQHGDEREVILKPGAYLVRVSTKYTKTGEVDPLAADEQADQIAEVVAMTQEFAKTWVVPDYSKVTGGNWDSTDVDRLLMANESDKVLKLASKLLKDQTVESMQQLIDFYNSKVKPLDAGLLESHVADAKVGKIVTWLTDLRASMNDTVRSKDHVTPTNSSGRVARSELSAIQMRALQLAQIGATLKSASKSRVVDARAGEDMSRLSSAFTGNRLENIHRKGGEAQRAELLKVAKAIGEKANVDLPEDPVAAISAAGSVIQTAERTGALLNLVKRLHTSLKSAVESA